MLADQLVMVNFITIAGHDKYPAIACMACIADRLGARIGRDIAIYTISIDPRDTPARLKAHAEQHGALRKG